MQSHLAMAKFHYKTARTCRVNGMCDSKAVCRSPNGATTRKRKSSGATQITTAVKNLVSLIKGQMNELKVTHQNGRTSLGDAIGLLTAFPGIEEFSELYFFGLDLIGVPDTKDLWMALPNDKLRLQYLPLA
ncbi:hypothetical protein U1Q18_000713 [Sarracenia purpurea var. burkii]